MVSSVYQTPWTVPFLYCKKCIKSLMITTLTINTTYIVLIILHWLPSLKVKNSLAILTPCYPRGMYYDTMAAKHWCCGVASLQIYIHMVDHTATEKASANWAKNKSNFKNIEKIDQFERNSAQLRIFSKLPSRISFWNTTQFEE